MLQKLEELQAKQFYAQVLMTTDRKDKTSGFKEQMVELDNILCDVYPELFKGKLNREIARKPTVPENARIFKRRFEVDCHHKIVPSEANFDDKESSRAYDSFGNPDW